MGVTPGRLGHGVHIPAAPFVGRAPPGVCQLSPQTAQNPTTGLKGPCSPSRTRLPGQLTGSASIVLMMRGYWVLALEGLSPPGWAGALVDLPSSSDSAPCWP